MELPLIILGLGNKILGDDGAGILVAEKLKKRLQNVPQIKVDTTSLGGLRIIDFIKDYNSAIIIDTIKSGMKLAGHIYIFSHKDFINSLRMVSYHDINFCTAIEFAKKMNIQMPQEILIYAIEAKKTDVFTYKISREIKTAIDICTEKIISFIEKEFNLKNTEVEN